MAEVLLQDHLVAVLHRVDHSVDDWHVAGVRERRASFAVCVEEHVASADNASAISGHEFDFIGCCSLELVSIGSCRIVHNYWAPVHKFEIHLQIRREGHLFDSVSVEICG